MDEMQEYRQVFLQEAKEYLDLMNHNFIKLEKGDREAINEIFRVAHTIKGMAGFMGFKNLEKLCHKLESAMGKIRDENIEITSDMIDSMLKAVDKIGEIITKIENESSDDVEIEEEINELKNLTAEDAESREDTTETKDVKNANVQIDIVLSEDCMMKSVRAVLILESLSEVAEIIGTFPDEKKIDSGEFDRSFTIYLKVDKIEELENVLSRIAEIDKYKITEIAPQTKQKTPDEPKKEPKNVKKLESIRVNISQLDTIMNLVGELVISKSRLLQIATEYNIPELREAVSIMDKAITSLQDEIMQMRMVKVERVFSKFPRMVRDLAKKLGKKVDLIMEGLDTELDRTVLDEISDPLIHLIRNAIDHGIEPPEERKNAGKDEIGKIKLSAWREKNNIIIEIEDDGRGFDLVKIKQKAVEKGLITQNEAESMSEEEIKMLIFAPGFSTRDEVSEISGRGVGMDVVKTTVEKLGGTIKIFSEKGKGTKIRIQLPPTVAIIKSLLINVGNETYAIPISSVVEALYVTDENLKFVHGSPFLLVRGKLIPAFYLRDLFGTNGMKREEKEVGIIVEKEGEKYALIADSISEQQEIVIKPLTGFLSKIKGFSGVTILGDGRVVPIIDVLSLIGGDKFV
uniref:Chemotaxis protein CheA n=1 Tax=Geoglobus ahangari TaxID=113653 RepID=A0A7C3UH08_9EURY